MSAHLIRFGAFEVDQYGGELHKHGRRLRLSAQPFEILLLLLQRAGRVVTRDELRAKLWSTNTFVDFDHGLNAAINKLRDTLGDSASRPRFIETVPGRGYRFIGSLEKPKLMIAVLPFENLNGDPEQDYFSDGLTEEMITHLGRLHPERLGTIARTSVMPYKKTNKRLEEIATELGVDYILEGSVRKSGQRLRVAAQLIDAADETHLWAESYDYHLSDILTLQNTIAEAIANQIELKLTLEKKELLVRPRRVAPGAHDAYLRGLYQLRKLSREGAEKAITHFEDATQKDASYALAYAGLARAHLALTTFYVAPLEGMPKVKAAAMKAIELDDSLAEAHASLGLVQFFFDWDWDGSEKEFQRALTFNPNLAEAHAGYAGLLIARGLRNEAFLETKKALELDPVPVASRGEYLWQFYVFRQYDETIRQCQKAIDLEPNFFLAHTVMGWALAEQGRFAEAVARAEAGHRLGGSPFALAGLGYIYAKAGDREKAARILEELSELSNHRYVCGYSNAAIYAALGDNEQALDWLERAYGERSD